MRRFFRHFLPAVLVVVCGAMAAAAQTTVGQYGNPEHLVVEGTHAFTAKQVTASLLWNFDVLMAAHPAAPLDDYLDVLRRKTTAGYRNAGISQRRGFRADARSPRGEVIIHVIEGPRYLAGEIRVQGQRTIPLPELIERLTRPYPPEEAVLQQAARLRRPWPAGWIEMENA